eukprot:7266058-Alexandrium_andersonii.AAC.1
MSASLVGSEMCIRDRRGGREHRVVLPGRDVLGDVPAAHIRVRDVAVFVFCLLYTSDAADDM